MILAIDGKTPKIDKTAFIAPNATIAGDVTIAPYVSIWFQAVIRGDINSIMIGKYTNVQDLCMIHVPKNISAVIGENVTIGHKALLHGCKIGDNCLIGMGSIIMDNVEIGENCIVGAGSLITEGARVPPGSLVFGAPAKVRRELTPEEIQKIEESARHYYEYSKMYEGLKLY